MTTGVSNLAATHHATKRKIFVQIYDGGSLNSEVDAIMHPENVDTSRFLALYAAHEMRLRGYVLSLVPRWSDAEDIIQRCSLILWQKFDQYEPGTNFFAWACQIVRFDVKAAARNASRHRVLFDDEFLESVAQETVDSREELEARIDALQSCVGKLPESQRELLRLRYDERRSVGSVAKILNRPLEGVYKALSRIRLTLYDCIQERISASET